MAKADKKKLENVPTAVPIEEIQPPEPEPIPEIPEIEELAAPPAQEDAQEELAEIPAHEPEPEKRKPGRPRKDDPPAPRSSIIQRINNLDSWEDTRVYVLRWEPFWDAKAGGKQGVSVKRYEGPFDEQDMLEDPGMGSGTYELIVNRTDPETRKRRVIDSGVVKLFNMKYPPRIPKGSWVDDPKNKEWEWARNISDKMDTPGAVPIQPTADPLVMILRDQIAAQREDARARDAEMERLRVQLMAPPKPDPGQQTLFGVLTQFAPLIIAKLTAPPPPPPPPPPPSALEQLAVTLLTKRLTDEPAVAKPADAASELDRALELQKKIKELSGDGESRGRTRKTGMQETVTEVTESIMSHLGPALQPIGQVIAMGMARSQQQAAAQQQQQPQPQPQHQPPLAAALPPAPQPQPIAHQQPGPQIVKPQPTLEDFATAVLDHLVKGKVGLNLGDWYLERYGEKEFTEIRTQGKPKLLADLQNTQPWAAMREFVENGDLDQLLTDFVTWQPDDEPDEDEDEDEAADPIAEGWEAEETHA